MRLEIMLIIIMMHPRPVYRTVLAFVGSVTSVGGSPHKCLFSCWWTIGLFWSPPCIWSLKRQIYIMGHAFLKLHVCVPCGSPPYVSAQWLICLPAGKITWDLQKTQPLWHMGGGIVEVVLWFLTSNRGHQSKQMARSFCLIHPHAVKFSWPQQGSS